jgi:pseudouridine-5'-phosphate glycosidase
MNNYLEINPEVKNALDQGRAVVALETTIISHGFSFPENLDCAQTCEKIIREEGAVPATIGIVQGKIKIGLTDGEIRYFSEHRDIPKCSRRDVAVIIAGGAYGATTVATTMMFAKMAGIKIFATGGIGGVHRGAQQTFDISADLEELAQTDVTVVCAGAKSILDIPLTLEYLETAGVCVIGFQTDEFPSFYTRKSGCKVDYRIDSAGEAARLIKVKNDLGVQNGLIVAVPIPEEDEMDGDFISDNITRALEEAERQGIKGKAATPFLLAELHKTTGGKSVAANKALVFNNAKTAARIASALAAIR